MSIGRNAIDASMFLIIIFKSYGDNDELSYAKSSIDWLTQTPIGDYSPSLLNHSPYPPLDLPLLPLIFITQPLVFAVEHRVVRIVVKFVGAASNLVISRP